MNILVLAYQLSPTKGSEYSVAWNYVQRMSKYHHLTVIYGVSGTHLGDCSEMKNYIKEKGGIHNVVFIDVQPNKWVNLLNWCNRHNFLIILLFCISRMAKAGIWDCEKVA